MKHGLNNHTSLPYSFTHTGNIFKRWSHDAQGIMLETKIYKMEGHPHYTALEQSTSIIFLLATSQLKQTLYVLNCCCGTCDL